MSKVYVVFKQTGKGIGAAYTPVKAFSSKQRAEEMAAQLKEDVREFCHSLLSLYERENQAVWESVDKGSFKDLTSYYNHMDILIDELESKILSENKGKTWMDDESEVCYVVVGVDYE